MAFTTEQEKAAAAVVVAAQAPSTVKDYVDGELKLRYLIIKYFAKLISF